MSSRLRTRLRAGTGLATASLSLEFATASGTLDPRITFSRGSQSTLVDATGKLTYAPNNVITNSVGPSASTGTAVTMIANGAPDGTSGIRLSKTDATTPRYCNWTTSFTVQGDTGYIASAYFKYDGYDTTVSLEYNNVTHWGKGWVAAFNVTSSGVTASPPSLCTSGVQSVGNGWFRVWAAFTSGTPSAPTSPTILTRITGGSGTSVLVAWGQIEAVTYQTTPGTYNSTSPKNLLGYTQEFDNAAWTKSNAFVQTNLLTYSQAFDNAAWVVSDATASANVSTAPDGSATADRVSETATTAFHAIVQTLATVSATNHVLSIYLKKGSGATAPDWVQLTFGGASTSYANFNLATGAVGVVSGLTANITSVGSGWYRCSVIVAIPTAGALSVQVAFTNNTDSATRRPSYAGATTSDVLVWGAQLVQGSTAGDYQRTDAAAAAVQYTAPDGSRTADKLVETTVNGGHYVLQSITALAIPYTFSAHVKAAERTFAMIYNAQTNAGQVINLSTGALAGNAGLSAPTSSSVTDVGNGWYLLSMTITATAASNNFRIYAMSDATTFNYAGDGTSGIYIWGAQLSNSASLDAYSYNPVAAPTSAAYYGPRFDYDPIRLTQKGLLIEEQRVNLLTYSEQFDNAAWTKTDSVITTNAIVSPDGTVNAEKIAENVTTVGQYMARQTYASFVAGAYTFTFYAKAAERTWTYFEVGNTYAYVNLSTGAVGSTGQFSTGWTFGSASATPVGNGWYRCSITSTCTTPGSYFGGKIHVAQNNNVISYAGTIGSGIYIYGAQLEAGSFATSYIPTVASQVTRTADVALMQGANFSNWYNLNQGTFVAECTPMVITGDRGVLSANDGTGNNNVDIRASSSPTSVVATGGASQAILTASGATVGVSSRLALAYAANNFAAVRDGGTPAADASGTTPAVDRMQIGNLIGSTAYALNGHISRIGYYPTRLSNAQLQALTAQSTIPSLSLDFTTQVFNVG